MRIGVSATIAGMTLLVYMALAVLSGVDRLATQATNIVGPNSWGYAANAPVNAARDAISRRDWNGAVGQLIPALMNDPVDEHVVGVLGLARYGAGDLAGANAAFLLGGKLGWRDLPTHLHLLQAGIEAGDIKAAMMQTDALLVGQGNVQVKANVLSAMLQYQEGRDALVARMRGKPIWASEFANGDDIEHASVDDIAGRAEVIARAGPGIVDCRTTSVLMGRLLDAGLFDEARGVHAASCAFSGTPLNDGNFDALSRAQINSRMDWSWHVDGDVAVGPAMNDAGQSFSPPRIRASNARASTALVLTQMVIAPAGSFRISWAMPDTNANDAAALMVSFGCDTDLGTAAPGTAVAGKSSTYSATVRFDGRCPDPVLSFWLKPGKDVNLAQVRFEQLQAAAE